MNYNPLSENERKRHLKLIEECGLSIFQKQFSKAQFLNNGVEKGAYLVSQDNQDFIVLAANRDYISSLIPEYAILNSVQPLVEEYLPKPIAHFSSREANGEAILMEYFDHPTLNMLQKDFKLNRRDLAYKIGEVSTDFTLKTGRVITEPHDENILGKILSDGCIELKLIDASQLKEGDLFEGIDYMLFDRNLRTECHKFTHKFNEGVQKSLDNHGMKKKFKTQVANKIRSYNPIF